MPRPAVIQRLARPLYNAPAVIQRPGRYTPTMSEHTACGGDVGCAAKQQSASQSYSLQILEVQLLFWRQAVNITSSWSTSENDAQQTILCSRGGSTDESGRDLLFSIPTSTRYAEEDGQVPEHFGCHGAWPLASRPLAVVSRWRVLTWPLYHEPGR